MRGDRICVNTREGTRGRDEGSECSQALPYNSVRDFRINQVSGRSRIRLAQEPNRNNNYTAMIEIEERQGGADSYAFDVTWRTDEGAGNAPAPFFDEVLACQDVVRQQFLKKKGCGAYIDFDGFADRPNQGQGGSWRRNTGAGTGTYSRPRQRQQCKSNARYHLFLRGRCIARPGAIGRVPFPWRRHSLQ